MAWMVSPPFIENVTMADSKTSQNIMILGEYEADIQVSATSWVPWSQYPYWLTVSLFMFTAYDNEHNHIKMSIEYYVIVEYERGHLGESNQLSPKVPVFLLGSQFQLVHHCVH